MKYYARRLGFYIFTLWAAVSLNFFLPRLMPGDPARTFRAQLMRNGTEWTEAMEATVRLVFGDSNAPLWTQYVQYWKNLARGDLGLSTSRYPAPVSELITQALPWTLALVGTATIISFIIGISMGAWVGWKRGTWADGVVPITTLTQSVPYFWIALLMVAFFAVENQWFPSAFGYDLAKFPDGPEFSGEFFKSTLYHAVLPAATILVSSIGGWMLGMRNMMVATLSEDYVTTAEAKGLRPSRVMNAYAVRNAALPSIAGFGITLGFVVAGSVVMEQVFTYPGVGKLLITSVTAQDYSLVQGVFLVITLTVLAANFIMDILYGFIDPRARQNV